MAAVPGAGGRELSLAEDTCAAAAEQCTTEQWDSHMSRVFGAVVVASSPEQSDACASEPCDWTVGESWLGQLERAARVIPKGKAVPRWSVPPEIVSLVLMGSYALEPRHLLVASPFARIIGSKEVPWQISDGDVVKIPKLGVGASGTEGTRLINLLDPWGKLLCGFVV